MLIGVGMDEAALRNEFDRCLLTDAEFLREPESWAGLPDPFPPWSLAAHDTTEPPVVEA